MKKYSLVLCFFVGVWKLEISNFPSIVVWYTKDCLNKEITKFFQHTKNNGGIEGTGVYS